MNNAWITVSPQKDGRTNIHAAHFTNQCGGIPDCARKGLILFDLDTQVGKLLTKCKRCWRNVI